VPLRNDRTFVTQRHNRTAIGIRDDGTVLLVTIDGRTRQSEGLSLPDLTRLMRYLGCRDALNLDGGGSTTMYVEGHPNDGIVNHPSDNGRYDSGGERGVSNCIVVK
jgi:exopolysaccharide biosynthesis protein